MKSYIGTKVIQAEPMTIQEYNQKHNIVVPANVNATDGYKVQYEDGYESWSPKEVFERCYREITDSEKRLIT